MAIATGQAVKSIQLDTAQQESSERFQAGEQAWLGCTINSMGNSLYTLRHTQERTTEDRWNGEVMQEDVPCRITKIYWSENKFGRRVPFADAETI